MLQDGQEYCQGYQVVLLTSFRLHVQLVSNILLHPSLDFLQGFENNLGRQQCMHYRSKTHFFTNNQAFYEKYVNFCIRNILEVMEKVFERKTKNLKFFWSQQDLNLGTSRPCNLLGKIKSRMLENGSLWASFVKNGALYSRHQKRSLWHRFLCPHYRGALDGIGPKSVTIGPLVKIFQICFFMQQVLDFFWIFFKFGLENRTF